jgi:SAM-dependent methyltransferase
LIFQPLRRALNRAEFEPSPFMLVNPFYFARKGLYDAIAALAPNVTGRTLDVGCGTKPYESLFRFTEYIGLEIDSPGRPDKKADYYYDGETFPFPDASFDSLITSEVLEHVFNPDRFVSEMARVLRPGGVLLLTVPFVWDEHEQPVDYGRYSSYGLRHLLEKGGFEIVAQHKTMADVRMLAQLVNAYVYKAFMRRGRIVRWSIRLTFVPAINLAGELSSRLFPKNEDLFLDNIALARRR